MVTQAKSFVLKERLPGVGTGQVLKFYALPMQPRAGSVYSATLHSAGEKTLASQFLGLGSSNDPLVAIALVKKVLPHAGALPIEARSSLLLKEETEETASNSAHPLTEFKANLDARLLPLHSGESLYGCPLLVEEAGSSESRSRESQDIAERLEEVFGSIDEEVFEQGIESPSGKAFVALLDSHGHDAITELALIVTKRFDRNALQEVLSWLGQAGSESTKTHRRWLLERTLSDTCDTLRYGAIMGLSFLDDPGSLGCLQKALEHEKNDRLRRLLLQLEQQLQETAASNGPSLQAG